MCQTSVTNPKAIFELNVFAVVGNKFVRYGYGIGGTRPREGEHSIFTPVGRSSIVGGCCKTCTIKCQEEWLAKCGKSKKETGRFFIVFLCVALIGVVCFPLVSRLHLASAWHILPIAVAGLGALGALGVLMQAHEHRAKARKGFSIETCFTNSESFKKEATAIATSIDVSRVRFKFGNPSALGPLLLEVKQMEAFAAKENNLLLLTDVDILSNLTACDFYEDRYWYLTSAVSGESLLGFDTEGNPSGFKRIYPNIPPKMVEVKNIRFAADKNASVACFFAEISGLSDVEEQELEPKPPKEFECVGQGVVVCSEKTVVLKSPGSLAHLRLPDIVRLELSLAKKSGGRVIASFVGGVIGFFIGFCAAIVAFLNSRQVIAAEKLLLITFVLGPGLGAITAQAFVSKKKPDSGLLVLAFILSDGTRHAVCLEPKMVTKARDVLTSAGLSVIDETATAVASTNLPRS